MKHKVLIAGGSGVVGKATVDYLTGLPDWEVVALSRRSPATQGAARFVPVDLTNLANCREMLSQFKDFTHIVYAALQEQESLVAGWTDTEHIRLNRDMLANLLDAVETNSPNLRRVVVMHGAKAYGLHLGNQQGVPYKESDQRRAGPNFYFDQEDLLRDRRKKSSWDWTILRPPGICSTIVGSPMSTVIALGVYLSICRELGIPFLYPGTVGNVKEVVDARLLARSTAWACTSPNSSDQIFNVANGDCFMWENLWPRFAELFGVPYAPPQPESLAKTMPDRGAVWDRVVAKHGLRPYGYKQMVPSWDFMDFTFRYGRPPSPALMSTIKIRQAGFIECMDTEQMFLDLLRSLQVERILPK